MYTGFVYLFPIQKINVLAFVLAGFAYIVRRSAKCFGYFILSSRTCPEYPVRARTEHFFSTFTFSERIAFRETTMRMFIDGSKVCQ